jgi:hypothetical protein
VVVFLGLAEAIPDVGSVLAAFDFDRDNVAERPGEGGFHHADVGVRREIVEPSSSSISAAPTR